MAHSVTGQRRVLLYYAWSRPAESGAPLGEIDDRFPALFEARRIQYPRLESLFHPVRFDAGIAGFLDHIQKPNFAAFVEQASEQSGHAVVEIERVGDDGTQVPFDDALVARFDTIVIISFDSLRTQQAPSQAEIASIARFLDQPDHVLFVCPHHDIGEARAGGDDPAVYAERQLAEHWHHGDPGIPPRQGFGGFARSLLAGLGVPVMNRFGFRPAALPDGSPAPIAAERQLDDLGLLDGVTTLNLHAHLPQLDREGDAIGRMDVLARQPIDPEAPQHPAIGPDRTHFDALLQSRPEVFAGRLYVCDTTTFSGTAGGLDSLRRLWANLVQRAPRGSVQ